MQAREPPVVKPSPTGPGPPPMPRSSARKWPRQPGAKCWKTSSHRPTAPFSNSPAYDRRRGRTGPPADGDRTQSRCDRSRGACAQQGCRLYPRRPERGCKSRSFPFTRFGTVPAAWSRSATIPSPTPNSAELLARIKLQRASVQSEGAAIPLTPGMAVVADIHTGKRRIVSWLISPLVETASQAAREH